MIHYFKRLRMEFDFRQTPVPTASLPPGFHWASWQPSYLEQHAWAKFESFREQIDSIVFDNLAHYPGCLQLMWDITNDARFLPSATWLIVRDDRTEACGTIQGIRSQPTVAAIQNVGVIPTARRLGLGRALVCQTLQQCSQMGFARVSLEATAANEPAIDLYAGLGFRVTRILYREVALNE